MLELIDSSFLDPDRSWPGRVVGGFVPIDESHHSATNICASRPNTNGPVIVYGNAGCDSVCRYLASYPVIRA